MSAANGTGVKKVNGHAGKSRSHSSSEPATTSQSASAKGKQKANGDDQYDAYTSALRGVEDSDMQQRQFTRVRDGQDLDELEGGSGTGYDNVAEKGRADSSGIRPKDTYNGHSYTSNDSEKHRNAGIRSPILRSETGLGHRRIASTASDKDDIPRAGLTERDKRAMVLLVALYLLQGLPVGLAFGSIPYLLRSKLSYSQIGIFTLCTYPYSLKLLWSPVVDSLFSPKLGRRKSWIIPIQLIVGSMLWWLSNNINQYMDKEVPDVSMITFLFFVLVFFAATQDIAVDGWALTLLSRANLSYASTAQTIGLNCGYFLSFTVFLAFNSIEFSNKYFRAVPLDYPLVSLPGYLRFASVAYIVITVYLAIFQPEDPVASDDPDLDLKRVYSVMYRICKLKHVQAFALVHLVAKLGTATNDAATSLKLLEKGLSKEDLALAVLIDFPFQILFGWLAAGWSKGDKPLRPWIRAMWFRLLFASTGMLLVAYFPSSTSSAADEKGISGSQESAERHLPMYYFFFVIASTILGSFASTVQFGGISAFHTQIADPAIGGTYMTLLNTVSNLGGTWPRYFVLRGVDSFTKASCIIPTQDGADNGITISAQECVSDHGKAICADLGGRCITERDGYYITSSICIVIGAVLLVLFIQPAARKLQALPKSSWRVKLDRQ